MRLVSPLQEFGAELCSVQNPSDYLGGEFGQTVKPHAPFDSLYNVAVAFPDLYRIAMANQAVKIIYNGLNALPSVRCERVFAPAEDFERLLKEKGIPLYTLETGMALHDLDLLGFSIGYELGIMGVLSILDCGRIPLLKAERAESDPIVIAGGCGATNPAVFADFFDAVFIGEAEDAMFSLVHGLAERRRSGASRAELLAVLAAHPNVWTGDMHGKIAVRAVFGGFGAVPSVPSYFPMPNSRPVQDHGVVEIMRGCPNGCRFCHAGIYYRPQRMKSAELVLAEVDALVNKAGYREISLTSLSSGDYEGIAELLDLLDATYGPQSVSFQLPSLKVNSFTLPLLEKLSRVRRCGLTFAVETPDEMWQLSLNKEVYAQRLEAIILEAKKRGWSTAKFYFMVGLPLPPQEGKSEEQAIVDFMLGLQARTRIQCNVNVGTFVPKPHTPYQWARQISPQESQAKLDYIRARLPRGKFKVSTHNPETSFFEGLVSRGDRRVGKVLLEIYRRGARLDAWEDNIRRDAPLWRRVLAEQSWDAEQEILRERSLGEALPWDSVSLGPSRQFFHDERMKSETAQLTRKCAKDCRSRCGVCNSNRTVHSNDTEYVQNIIQNVSNSVENKTSSQNFNIELLWRCVFSFEKISGGEYIPYLSMVEIFHKALLRSGLPVLYTNGFNPLPRIEFASALPLGVVSRDEVASCVFRGAVDDEEFVSCMSGLLPGGLRVVRALVFPVTRQRRRESLASSHWGGRYRYHFRDARAFAAWRMERGAELEERGISCAEQPDGSFELCLPFPQDKAFRAELEALYGAKLFRVASVTKTLTLAVPEVTGWSVSAMREFEERKRAGETPAVCARRRAISNRPVSYFELYEEIARLNAEFMR